MPATLPPRPTNGDLHAWHLYVLRLNSGTKVSRDSFIDQMTKKGIGCSVHFIPLHIHPYWRDRYQLQPDDFPKALKAYEGAVSLPIYSKMTSSDVERVITAVHEILA